MKLVKRIEKNNNISKVIEYYFLGKIPYLKKEKSLSGRKTFLFGFLVSDRPAKISTLINTLNYQDVLSDVSTGEFIKSPIDIVIPIYNGLEYLPDLFESIRLNTDLDYRIIAVNDCSTDYRVKDFLTEQMQLFSKKLLVIENEQNLGFVKSVNKALKLTKNHVCLLNTDVVLPKNWASKLFAPIFANDNTASVTPFSNAATIFSLPVMNIDNKFEQSLGEVNKALAKINPFAVNIDFPTGVGFCMAMNKDVINKIGILDEVFEKGYGEENDRCQRAVKNGFINTIAPDLFVWHKHGGSFASDEKKALIAKHSAIISKRYPNYEKDVRRSVMNKNYQSLHFLAEILYFSALADESLLWFDHSLGGGAETYTFRQIEKIKNQKLVLRLQDCNGKSFKLEYFYQNNKNSIFISYEDLTELSADINVGNIVLNNIADYTNNVSILKYIDKLKKIVKGRVTYLLHDYQCICPNINMVNNLGQYCCVKKLDNCSLCYKKIIKPAIKVASVAEFQTEWFKFLQNTADEIIAFSKASCDILVGIYPEIENKIKIIPHVIPHLREVQIAKHQKINIATLGNITLNKGADIVKNIDSLLHDFPNINLVVVGECQHKLKNSVILGKYDVANLPDIMEKHQIDIILIPSIGPETFSFTTSEAMDMGLSVACFGFGAPAERVALYKKGLVLDNFDAANILRSIVKHISDLKNADNLRGSRL